MCNWPNLPAGARPVRSVAPHVLTPPRGPRNGLDATGRGGRRHFPQNPRHPRCTDSIPQSTRWRGHCAGEVNARAPATVEVCRDAGVRLGCVHGCPEGAYGVRPSHRPRGRAAYAQAAAPRRRPPSPAAPAGTVQEGHEQSVRTCFAWPAPALEKPEVLPAAYRDDVTAAVVVADSLSKPARTSAFKSSRSSSPICSRRPKPPGFHRVAVR